MYAHPGITVVFLSWIIGGLVAIKDAGAIQAPVFISIFYGIFKVFTITH